MDVIQANKNTSDSEIIDKIKKGDTNLYQVIVHRYNGYLYKVGKSYGFHHSDIEDLMQETYIKAFEHLKDFEGRSSLKTWLVHIMYNSCFHKKQKPSFRREQPASEHLENEPSGLYSKKTVDGNHTVQNHELRKMIDETILQIPEEYRMVFTLREEAGLSTSETAHILNISEDNVKVRLSRARKMLQAVFEKSYPVYGTPGSPEAGDTA